MNICIGCKLWGNPVWVSGPSHCEHICILTTSALIISQQQHKLGTIHPHVHFLKSIFLKVETLAMRQKKEKRKKKTFFSFAWAVNHESGFPFKPTWCGGGENAYQRCLQYWLGITLKFHIPFGVAPSGSLWGESKVWCWQTSCWTYKILPKNKINQMGTWCGQMSRVCCCWHFIKAMWVCVIILMLKKIFFMGIIIWNSGGRPFMHQCFCILKSKQAGGWNVFNMQE